MIPYDKNHTVFLFYTGYLEITLCTNDSDRPVVDAKYSLKTTKRLKVCYHFSTLMYWDQDGKHTD